MYCKSRDCVKHKQPPAIPNRIHPEHNLQVGCYIFQFDLKLTMNESAHVSSASQMSQSTETSSNAALPVTQPHHRHQLVHHWPAKTASENMTQDVHS